ncbi:hypothetical protein [Nocardiopsis suaedae]|uniref:Peptidoglycan binding-like domain-containing protein n=1 Tax=Nocardiopsis suaedae TaxID=3018444 RepID=A0ABT4TVK6_9ACTN|nr:hypothetical protein [Nocardiopsis suaedae]MDA2808735.1 hypothetical protein [Nocardiopsis suaedae]
MMTAIHTQRAPMGAAGAVGGGVWRAARVPSVLAGLFWSLVDAERVLPEADPAEVRWRLIELGLLDPCAAPGARSAALARFQEIAGLPGTGRADGPTVSALAAAAAHRREMRELGLDGVEPDAFAGACPQPGEAAPGVR